MAKETKKDNAARRVKKGFEALATFARIREELLLKQATIPAGRQRDRLEKLLRVNEETMVEMRKVLWRAEDERLTELSAATKKPAVSGGP